MTIRDPKDIMRIAFGFFGAQVLLTATKLELFTELGEQALDAQQLGSRLQLHPRPVRDFLDALVALRLLERDGDGPEARYRNTADTREHLDRRSPAYVGGILIMAQQRMYRSWAHLETALRTGQPQSEIRDADGTLFSRLYADPEALSGFLAGMQGGHAGRAAADLPGVRRALRPVALHDAV
jgi:hypothetical protein